MTHDELREKVARALCWADGCDPDELDGSTDPHPQWMAYEEPADAAIAVVIEEAARALMAVERYDIDTDYCSLDKTEDGELMHAEDAFAALRALIRTSS